MASPELYILDVGHGNCAILKTLAGVIVIDVPSEPVVATMLDSLGVDSIENLIISHADSDHLSGANALLMDERRPVRNVHVNPDRRNASVWHRFRAAVRNASHRGTKVHSVLSHQDPGRIVLDETVIEILHPMSWACLATVDGRDLSGAQQNANSMSGVVMIKHKGDSLCLLAGDADKKSLTTMLEEGVNLNADILVFPHHGGHSNRARGAMQRQQNQEFAKSFSDAVSPELTVFSLGRNKHRTPQPEIIAGVRDASNSARLTPHIACTQLSANCAARLPSGTRSELDARSAGARFNSCCSGSIGFPLDAERRADFMQKFKESHSEFVIDHVPQALCRMEI
ncbi:ComEC/Rec2 family competence protein [Xanthomonas arboricola]|uniref:ComEC/Rec2 family competence protein n=1 Tax=Xanthomonas arboricola TaxID=56448 RepID=UPI0012D2AB17|nr:MBL fold metallo-hydrolase [Xanthomonas arboricola]